MNRLEGERATSQEPQLAFLLCVAIVRGVVRTGVRICNWRCCTLLGACAGERLLPRTTNTRPAHHARPTLTCCPSSIEGALLDSTAAVWMPHMHTGVCTRCCCHVMRLHVVRCVSDLAACIHAVQSTATDAAARPPGPWWVRYLAERRRRGRTPSRPVTSHSAASSERRSRATDTNGEPAAMADDLVYTAWLVLLVMN